MNAKKTEKQTVDCEIIAMTVFDIKLTGRELVVIYQSLVSGFPIARFDACRDCHAVHKPLMRRIRRIFEKNKAIKITNKK